MRCANRKGLSPTLLALLLLAGCGEEATTAVDPETGAVKTAAPVRAQRRAYDGAPPVIGHPPMGASCTACHNERGMQVEGVGFAPPSPHANTLDPSNVSRCEQCHVYARVDGVFRENSFAGLPQDLRKGPRLNPLAPPVIPHQVLMRENCAACHAGTAAREEIRTPHPERTRCTQCHVPVVETGAFQRPG